MQPQPAAIGSERAGLWESGARSCSVVVAQEGAMAQCKAAEAERDFAILEIPRLRSRRSDWPIGLDCAVPKNLQKEQEGGPEPSVGLPCLLWRPFFVLLQHRPSAERLRSIPGAPAGSSGLLHLQALLHYCYAIEQKFLTATAASPPDHRLDLCSWSISAEEACLRRGLVRSRKYMKNKRRFSPCSCRPGQHVCAVGV